MRPTPVRPFRRECWGQAPSRGCWRGSGRGGGSWRARVRRLARPRPGRGRAAGPGRCASPRRVETRPASLRTRRCERAVFVCKPTRVPSARASSGVLSLLQDFEDLQTAWVAKCAMERRTLLRGCLARRLCHDRILSSPPSVFTDIYRLHCRISVNWAGRWVRVLCQQPGGERYGTRVRDAGRRRDRHRLQVRLPRDRGLLLQVAAAGSRARSSRRSRSTRTSPTGCASSG